MRQRRSLRPPRAPLSLDDWEVLDLLKTTAGIPLPPAVEEIRDAEIRHRRECDPAGMEEAVAEILKL